jgi:peroxiredoxin
MQQIVNKYTQDGEIKFLFIDTLEKIENSEEKVRDIINKNNYSFHVLLDEDNSVANAYKITEAPVKVIIDPNGNIRFISRGYGGDDKLIEELDMMISMLR